MGGTKHLSVEVRGRQRVRNVALGVTAARKVDPAFPLTGTGDQLYGEFDFEAYRQLGWSVTKEALDGDTDPDAGVPAQRSPAEGSVPGASSP